jgi:DNA-directed RNA polymerase specialized sigma24 family protein
MDPSDVVQETLLQTQQAWGQLRGRSDRDVGQWLRRSLAHVGRDLRRARRDLAWKCSLESRLE